MPKGLDIQDVGRAATRQVLRPLAGAVRATDQVVWENGETRPIGEHSGNFPSLSFGELAAKANATGGPIGSGFQSNTIGVEGGFATHVVDVGVDTGLEIVTVLRYTSFQDVGRAIHPAYVEGQVQGGAAQGIGWALNEEYIYNKSGQVDNPGFLDDRMPVCSDLPMLDAVMIEVPNSKHPQGIRGVGEVPLVPPLVAISNAVYRALGTRFYALPMSPPKVLAALNAGMKQAAE